MVKEQWMTREIDERRRKSKTTGKRCDIQAETVKLSRIAGFHSLHPRKARALSFGRVHVFYMMHDAIHFYGYLLSLFSQLSLVSFSSTHIHPLSLLNVTLHLTPVAQRQYHPPMVFCFLFTAWNRLRWMLAQKIVKSTQNGSSGDRHSSISDTIQVVRHSLFPSQCLLTIKQCLLFH